MDLLERIKDTVPLHVNILDTPGAVEAAQNALAETYGRLEALADRHAVGFMKWIHDYCDWPKGKFYRYDGAFYSFEELLSIYKRRYPDGY